MVDGGVEGSARVSSVHMNTSGGCLHVYIFEDCIHVPAGYLIVSSYIAIIHVPAAGERAPRGAATDVGV